MFEHACLPSRMNCCGTSINSWNFSDMVEDKDVLCRRGNVLAIYICRFPRPTPAVAQDFEQLSLFKSISASAFKVFLVKHSKS